MLFFFLLEHLLFQSMYEFYILTGAKHENQKMLDVWAVVDNLNIVQHMRLLEPNVNFMACSHVSKYVV